jgi:alkylhydroperoxidase/carboxymuconolactone decarboxylase family protein YurZ
MDDAERTRRGIAVRRLEAEQIQEILLQVAVHAGVPVGNRAFSIAQRALAEAE